MSEIRKTTFREHPRLPLGILQADGTYARDLSFKPWTAKSELVVADLRQRRKATPAQVQTDVLAHFTDNWGGVDISAMQPPAAKRFLESAPACDFQAAWLALRIDALGDTYKPALQCSSCQAEYDVDVDLLDIEMSVLEGAFAPSEVTLAKPFMLGDERIEKLACEQIKWGFYASIAEAELLNTGQFKIDFVSSCVVQVNGKPRRLRPAQLESLTKLDLERLTNRIAEDALGPSFSFTCSCPACGKEVETQISTQLGPFFSARDSSRSGRLKTSSRKSSPSPTIAKEDSATT